MNPELMEGWHDFAVATAGAAGALAGLIMVAVSVNIKEILAGEGLPSRAGATIAAIVAIVVTSVAMLIPDQSALWLGLEIAVFGLVALYFQVDAVRRLMRATTGAGPVSRAITSVMSIAQAVLLVVGGVILAAGLESGLGVVAAGVITIFIVSMSNAWVLMVEILR